MKSHNKEKPSGESFTLYNDNGHELTFSGVIASESSYFDEETCCLTKLRLYVTDDSALVYSIVSGAGDKKLRRFYVIKTDGTLCTMNDGATSIVIPVDMLFTAVFGLCGIAPDRADEIIPVLEKTLRAVNG